MPMRARVRVHVHTWQSNGGGGEGGGRLSFRIPRQVISAVNGPHDMCDKRRNYSYASARGAICHEFAANFMYRLYRYRKRFSVEDDGEVGETRLRVTERTVLIYSEMCRSLV